MAPDAHPPAYAPENGSGPPDTPVARAIGRTRLIVFVGVVAILLCAISLFLLGGVLAAGTIWNAWGEVIGGVIEPTALSVRFLEIVSVMLKAVFFYLIGVGLYSLFIAPLNVTIALGVETLNDLETKVISVIIVIMAVRFLERFIEGESGDELLVRAGALGAVTAALVFFKIFAHREGQEHKRERLSRRAKREMFEGEHERHALGQGTAAPEARARVRRGRR